MNMHLRAGLLLLALAIPAGCTTSDITSALPKAKATAPAADPAPVAADEPEAEAPTGPASAADEAACRQAVAKTAGAAEMTVLSAEASAGNAEIVMGVGPEKARWQCLLSGGKVAGIMEVAEEVKF